MLTHLVDRNTMDACTIRNVLRERVEQIEANMPQAVSAAIIQQTRNNACKCISSILILACCLLTCCSHTGSPARNSPHASQLDAPDGWGPIAGPTRFLIATKKLLVVSQALRSCTICSAYMSSIVYSRIFALPPKLRTLVHCRTYTWLRILLS
jgi:hypothetical protein